jgi:hypothetical protein
MASPCNTICIGAVGTPEQWAHEQAAVNALFGVHLSMGSVTWKADCPNYR